MTRAPISHDVLRVESDRSLRSPRSAFTLVEVMIVALIIGVLISLMLPAAFRTMRASRGFSCKMGLRSVAFDFSVFADDKLNADRGDDDETGRGGKFRLETFQEYVYGVDEFWRYEDDDVHAVPDAQGNDPLRCPEVEGQLELRRNVACSDGAINPPRNISYGFNIRLHRAEVIGANGRPRYVPVYLSEAIRAEQMVPLVWEVDGARADSAGQYPIWSGPSMDSRGFYADDRFWYPALRHNGEMNVSFVDGHVDSTRTPLTEPNWLWSYQPLVH